MSRVLFVTHNFPRHAADLPGNFLLRLAIALRHVDVNVEVIAPHAAGLTERDTVDGIPVTRFRYASDTRETLAYGGTMAAQVKGSWRGKRDMWAFVKSMSRAIASRASSVDIVHAHWWFPAGLAATKRALGNRPLVTTMHGSDVRLARGFVGRRMWRTVLSRSTRTTAVSHWLADQVAARAGIDGTVVAPMPVEMSLFAPKHTRREGVLFVGKLDAQKGARVLIDALPHVDRSVIATIIGGGPDEAALRAHAANLGVASRVRWMGALPHHDLPAHYQRAQLLVVPVTEPEGLGLTAVEALLCETPVIASNLGGLADVVDDGASGRLIAPNDPAVLATSMRDALADKPQLDAWGREGRARVLARFDPAACATAYKTIYDEVMRGRAA